MTDSFLRFGHCSFYVKKTEWCAGIILQTKKKLIICDGYTKKTIDKERKILDNE